MFCSRPQYVAFSGDCHYWLAGIRLRDSDQRIRLRYEMRHENRSIDLLWYSPHVSGSRVLPRNSGAAVLLVIAVFSLFLSPLAIRPKPRRLFLCVGAKRGHHFDMRLFIAVKKKPRNRKTHIHEEAHGESMRDIFRRLFRSLRSRRHVWWLRPVLYFRWSASLRKRIIDA